MSAPDRIGRYRIDRLVGSGGFATVWLGRDEVLDAPVAVKVLADNWSHQLDVRERFLEEARILRRADSDRVVRVHDIGELDDGRPYFVMTYADGGTLSDKVAGGPVPVPDALRYGADVARGLAVLHETGVIHRDVNPANVLLRSGRDGVSDRVLVADLGLAKAAAHGSGYTQTVGTPGYMAPEQSTGDGVSKRADVYAVGALLLHLLTGKQPTAEELPTLPADIPAPVAEVVRQAVRRRPEDRYPSAGALADALDAARIASVSTPPVAAQTRRPSDALGETTERFAVPPARARASAADRRAPEAFVPERWEPRAAEPDDTMLLSRPDSRPDGRSDSRPDGRSDGRSAGRAERRPEPVAAARAPRRRRRGLLLTALGVVLLLLAGGAGVLVWRQRTTPFVTVRGTLAPVSVTVPRAWAGQRTDTTDAGMSVLLVAKDANGWADAASDVPGVRVAVGPATLKDADLLARNPATGCTATDKPWDSHGLTGTVYFYSGCATVGTTDFAEAVLRTPDHRAVFIQVKGPGDEVVAAVDAITLT